MAGGHTSLGSGVSFLRDRCVRDLWVVGEIGFQNPTEMALTEDDDVVETLPPYGSHEAFSIRILPRRPRCREDLLDVEALDATAELVAEDAVAVADHEPGRRVLGEGIDDLCEPTWLSRKVRQVCECGVRGLGGMKRDTLRSPMSMPSFSNSP